VKPATFHPQALAEIDEAVDWYNDKRPGLGFEFKEEANRSVAKIEADPGVGARYRSTDRRFFRLKRFPYVIYYKEFPDRVWIGHRHARRRPNYWRNRELE
jgi:toxin ParE1/3/4